MNELELLDPVDAFNNFYKEKMHQNTTEYFEKLLAESKVDVHKNKRLSDEYENDAKNRDAAKKRLSNIKTLRVFVIVATALAAALIIYGAYNSNVIMTVIASLVTIAGILVWLLSLNKIVKTRREIFEKLEAVTAEALAKAFASIEPLLGLFEGETTHELVMQTMPSLLIDKNFGMHRYDILSGAYGYPEDDGPESSTLDIMSGEINGNPYVFQKNICHRMGTQTYRGSKTISWTTHEIINGKTVTHHHTETLYASVTKPKPFYSVFTNLIYANDAAPELNFTRTKTHIEKLSEKKAESFVHSRSKKIKKYAKDHMAEGFTELGNEEFDAVFYALDRNDEVHFRQIFNPLAQQNLLKLMKGGSPYGDDFNYSKFGRINMLTSDHMQNTDLTVNPVVYRTYSVEKCRELFMSTNENFFKAIYFDLATFLAIPVYQQMKPQEYIYNDSYNRNCTVRETEALANQLGDRALAHHLSVTPAILKTSLVNKDNDVDGAAITAYSYRTVNRVDYIPKMGGDGHMHNVPVPWKEYIALTQRTKIELKNLELTERQYKSSEYKDLAECHAYFHNIFATLGDIEASEDSAPDEEGVDISEFGEIEEIDEIEETEENYG